MCRGVPLCWQPICGRFRHLSPAECQEGTRYALLTDARFFFWKTVDAENGEVIPAEDDDVARERDLIQCKPLAVLQQDNNLIIK